jgi:hypothetical protein
VIQRPRLKSFLTVFPISETTWGIRGGSDELWRIKLRDPQAFGVFSSVLPYLDGQNTLESISSLLADRGIKREEIQQLVEQMEQASLLEESNGFHLSPQDEAQFESQIAFFSRYSQTGGAKYQSRLHESRVGLIGNGRLSLILQRQLLESGFGEVVALGAGPGEGLPQFDGTAGGPAGRLKHRALQRNEIWPETDPDRPQLLLVAQEADDPQLLESIDAFSKRSRIPWLLIRALEASTGWVGPLFIPDETACYLSLEARLRGNLSYYPEHQAFSDHLRQQARPSAPCGGLHAFFELLSGIAVTETIKYVTELGLPALAGRFLTINLGNWEMEIHDVLRLPRAHLDLSRPRLFAWKEVPYEEIGDGVHTRRA